MSARAKQAIGRAATATGTSTTTGDGGMTSEERDASKTLVYQCLPSRYGFNPDDFRKADAVEIVVGKVRSPVAEAFYWGKKSVRESPRCELCPKGSTSVGVPASGLDGLR